MSKKLTTIKMMRDYIHRIPVENPALSVLESHCIGVLALSLDLFLMIFIISS